MSVSSWDLESALIRGANYDSRQIYQIFDEIDNNIIKQVNNNPRQYLYSFHKLCLHLFDRLFGEDTTVGIGSTLPSPWIKGESGGWLRKLIYIHVDSNININNNYYSNYNINYNHIIKIINILLPNNNLFNLISFYNKNLSNHLINPIDKTNYEMKLSFLPIKVLMSLKKTNTYSLVKSNNHDVYYTLLQIPLNDQIIQINNQSKDPTILLEPMEYFIICLLRYPCTSEILFTPMNQSSNVRMKYLSLSNKLPMHNSVNEWIKPFPYLILLKEYFNIFIPIGITNTIEDQTNTSVNKFSKLFLSILCDYWLDTSIIVRQNYHLLNQFKSNYVSSYYNRRSDSKIDYNPKPTDVIVLEGGQINRTSTSLQCVYLLLLHIQSDLTLAGQYKSSNLNFYNQFMQSNRLLDNVVNYLPKHIQIIQQPLYDMLRSVFSRNDMNVNEDVSFYVSIEIWLLYILPWKAHSIHIKGIDRSEGRYQSNIWKIYIVNNLHFYTTVLAIILKPISRMDLTIRSYDDMRKLSILLRIFNELTSDGLWDDVIDLSNDLRAWYNRSIKSHNINKLQRNFEVQSDEYVFKCNDIELNIMKAHHYNLYPDRSIDLLDDCGIISIYSYTKEYSKSLLYTINKNITTYNKSKADSTNRWYITNLCIYLYNLTVYFIYKLIVLFDINITTNKLTDIQMQEICKKCQLLINQLVYVLDIDLSTINFNDSSNNYNRHGDSYSDTIDYSLIKDKLTNKLTNYGKMKLLQGKLIFNIYNNISYNINTNQNGSDILIKPLMSYEVKPLTRILVKISKDLNVLYNLPINKQTKTYSWKFIIEQAFLGSWVDLPMKIYEAKRFNLRFLGSIYNLYIILSILLYYINYYHWKYQMYYNFSILLVSYILSLLC